jgi:hypothetical protein
LCVVVAVSTCSMFALVLKVQRYINIKKGSILRKKISQIK